MCAATPAPTPRAARHKFARAGCVLDLLFSGEVERQAQLALQLVIGRAGNHDPAGRRELLQSRRDIDAVSKEVVTLDYDVAQVDPDAENQPSFDRCAGLTFQDGFCIATAKVTASTTEPNSAMKPSPIVLIIRPLFNKKRRDRRAEEVFQSRQRRAFVGLDFSRITDDIGGDNGGQSADCRSIAPPSN